MKTLQIKDKSAKKGLKSIAKEVVIDKEDLPLTIIYKGKRYILILTKNDKLILNKYEG